MTQIVQPEVTFNLLNADSVVSNIAQKVLLVGSMLSGTATAGVVTENIPSTGSPENALFGRTSMMAQEVRAFRRINPLVQLDALPLADVGTQATFTITIVGTTTAAGELIVTAGSERFHRFAVSVPTIGSTPTQTAVLIVAAVNADLDCPFTASSLAGVVTLTADQAGVLGGYLGVEVAGSIAGITGQAVAIGVAGATNPTTTGILAAAVDDTTRYQAIVWPFWATAVADLVSFLDPRFNVTNNILDGVGFVPFFGSFADAITNADLFNSQSVVFPSDKQESETNYKGPAQNEASWDRAATLAAIKTLRLTDGANLAGVVTTKSSEDQFGGMAMASLPYFNTPTPGLSLVKTGRGYSAAEIALLTTSGATVLGNNPAKTGTIIGEVVTTFKKDSGGNLDPTWKFLNYVDTGSTSREYIVSNTRKRFAQSRLTTGEVTRGRDVANALIIGGYIERLYQDLSEFVLVERGAEAIAFFKKNLVVTITKATGLASVTMLLPIVTQLRGIVGSIKITFEIQGS